MNMEHVRVCYFGTYREDYARNKIMIRNLIRNGFEVIECHVSLNQGFEDRDNVLSKGWINPSLWIKLFWDRVNYFF